MSERPACGGAHQWKGSTCSVCGINFRQVIYDLEQDNRTMRERIAALESRPTDEQVRKAGTEDIPRIPQDALDTLTSGKLCPFHRECNSDDMESCHWTPDVHAMCEDASDVTLEYIRRERAALDTLTRAAQQSRVPSELLRACYRVRTVHISENSGDDQKHPKWPETRTMKAIEEMCAITKSLDTSATITACDAQLTNDAETDATLTSSIPPEVVEALYWAYLTGGGDTFMDMHGRLCFCPLHGREGQHSSACDELNTRLMALHDRYIRGGEGS